MRRPGGGDGLQPEIAPDPVVEALPFPTTPADGTLGYSAVSAVARVALVGLGAYLVARWWLG